MLTSLNINLEMMKNVVIIAHAAILPILIYFIDLISNETVYNNGSFI